MRFIFILIALSVSTYLNSQVAVSYFPFQSILSISTNNEKLCWAEYKIETNSFVSNFNMELSPKLNFRKRELTNYYVGPGVSFNPAYSFAHLSIMNGYFIDFGVRIKPLPKRRNLQIVFEISPYVNREFSGGNIRTRLGVAWNFHKSEEK
jgi:hypothetical protein